MALGVHPESLADDGQYPITVDEFIAANEAGLFTRTELLNGKVYSALNASPLHNNLVRHLVHALREVYGVDSVWSEMTVELTTVDAPQPDVAVLASPRTSDLYQPNPTAQDIACAIEVAVNTAKKDVERKLPLYRRVGIPAAYVLAVEPEGIRIHAAGHDHGVMRVIESVLAADDLTVLR